jgi:hypothetical protein
MVSPLPVIAENVSVLADGHTETVTRAHQRRVPGKRRGYLLRFRHAIRENNHLHLTNINGHVDKFDNGSIFRVSQNAPNSLLATVIYECAYSHRNVKNAYFVFCLLGKNLNVFRAWVTQHGIQDFGYELSPEGADFQDEPPQNATLSGAT